MIIFHLRYYLIFGLISIVLGEPTLKLPTFNFCEEEFPSECGAGEDDEEMIQLEQDLEQFDKEVQHIIAYTNSMINQEKQEVDDRINVEMQYGRNPNKPKKIDKLPDIDYYKTEFQQVNDIFDRLKPGMMSSSGN